MIPKPNFLVTGTLTDQSVLVPQTKLLELGRVIAIIFNALQSTSSL